MVRQRQQPVAQIEEDDVLAEAREELLHLGQHALTTWHKFTNWALQDNVLEVAVGLILATSFTAVVSSLSSDIILPIISLLPFFNRNLEEKFAILKPGLGGSAQEDEERVISRPRPYLGSAFSAMSTPNVYKAFDAINPPPSHNGWNYNTIEQALADGAVVLSYGAFLDKVVRFFLIGTSLYLIAKGYSWLSHDNIIKYTIKCPFCRKNISQVAKRCGFCTTWLNGRDGPVPWPR